MEDQLNLFQPKNMGGFVAGTLVHTREGLKPIEKIQVGDWVLSKPEFGEGEQAYKRVTRTVSFDEKEIWTIAISEKDVNDPNIETFYHSKECTRIIATPNHPFWVAGKGWTALRDVRLYDRLLLGNGRSAIIYQHMNLHRYKSSRNIAYCGTGMGMNEGYLIDLSLGYQVEFCVPEEAVPEPIEVDFYNPQTYFYTTVYNFEVEDFHTYHIGTNGVWVHNTNCAENIESLAGDVTQELIPSRGKELYSIQAETKQLTETNEDVIVVGEFPGKSPKTSYQSTQEMKVQLNLSQPKNQGCFVAGTLVHTKEGLKPIEQIQVGDWVLSKPEFGEGKQAYKRVTKTVSFEEKELWTVTFYEKSVRDAIVEKGLMYDEDIMSRIVATPNHPFFVLGKGWFALRELRMDDLLLLEGGDIGVVDSINIIHKSAASENVGFIRTRPMTFSGCLIDFSANEGVERCFPNEFVPEPIEADFDNKHSYFYMKVYNFEVEEFHTYYIGTRGVWVQDVNYSDNATGTAKSVAEG